jgi:hypothetical protein
MLSASACALSRVFERALPDLDIEAWLRLRRLLRYDAGGDQRYLLDGESDVAQLWRAEVVRLPR